MTLKEKVIATAYTGIMFLRPDEIGELHNVKGVVMFGEYSTPYTKGHWGYYVDWDLTKNLAIYCATNDIEVIGNKFDNDLEVQDEQAN